MSHVDRSVEEAKKRDRCETCRFYQPREEWEGLCRRMPPALIQRERCGSRGWTTETLVDFPDTGWANWCGEWKSKP